MIIYKCVAPFILNYECANDITSSLKGVAFILVHESGVMKDQTVWQANLAL